MRENRIFYYALASSAMVHFFLFAVVWLTDIQYHKEIQEHATEIAYITDIQTQPPEKDILPPIKSVTEKKKAALPQALTKAPDQKPQPIRPSDKQPVRLDLPEKIPPVFKDVHEKRQIKIPMLDSGSVMGPHYVTYHEQVRDKIRQRAYFYIDDPDFQSGEVYLTFVLGSDGRLKAVRVIAEKTRANPYLIKIGLRSIKEAAPFPAFPGGLNYPELTFNVVISFEAGN